MAEKCAQMQELPRLGGAIAWSGSQPNIMIHAKYKPREFQVFDPYFSFSSSFFPLDFSLLMDKVFAALLGRSHSE